jgi:hypothetical protein
VHLISEIDMVSLKHGIPLGISVDTKSLFKKVNHPYPHILSKRQKKEVQGYLVHNALILIPMLSLTSSLENDRKLQKTKLLKNNFLLFCMITVM